MKTKLAGAFMKSEYGNPFEMANEKHSNKRKLAIFDLDGTLFDTKEVNYLAYKEAVEKYGYHIDYGYFKDFCYGRHYMEFLPGITTDDSNVLRIMHDIKQSAYSKYVGRAQTNIWLFDLIETIKVGYYIALVTTASKRNTYEILQAFDKEDVFDIILTHEDISKSKPDPEGFLKAMGYFGICRENTIIFEDSDIGAEAAERSGAGVMMVRGFHSFNGKIIE